MIPPRMKHRPVDAHGYPIPFVQLIGPDGLPDFRVIDMALLQRCLARRLCGLCGEPMGRNIFFVGGPLCVPNGLFCDPPMHKDCAEFALRTCPHLANAKSRFSRAPLPAGEGLVVVEASLASDEKCEWFALMHTTEFTLAHGADRSIYIRAKLPWLDVERWANGVRL
jgi:hypothetical protein